MMETLRLLQITRLATESRRTNIKRKTHLQLKAMKTKFVREEYEMNGGHMKETVGVS